MRRVVGAETPALVAESTVRRIGRRHRHRQLRDRLRLGRIFDIDHPERLIRLVAVGIERFRIRDHKTAIEARDVDGVKRNRSRFHFRIEAADELRIFNVREIVDHHSKSAVGAVAVSAAVLDLLRHVHGTMQGSERLFVTVLTPFFILFLFAVALAG